MFVSTSLGSFYSAIEDGTNFILTITLLYNNNYFFYKKKTIIVKKITIVTFLKYSTTFWFYFLQMKTRGNYEMFQLLRNFYASRYLGITVVISEHYEHYNFILISHSQLLTSQRIE